MAEAMGTGDFFLGALAFFNRETGARGDIFFGALVVFDAVTVTAAEGNTLANGVSIKINRLGCNATNLEFSYLAEIDQGSQIRHRRPSTRYPEHTQAAAL